MKLTVKLSVTINKLVGEMVLAEVKTYHLTDEFAETMGVKEIIDFAKKVVESNLKNTCDMQDMVITCEGIVPVEVVAVKETVIEEPTTDAFDGAMNMPEEVPQNVVSIPEGFEKMEEVEESPFTNTYYDNETTKDAEIQEPTEVAEEYDEQEMFDKFLKLSFLTRQNLLIRDFALLSDEHKGERHKIAYPIAIKTAKDRGVLKDFYEAINKNSK